MMVTTDASIVCHRYPDTVNQDTSKLPHYTFATRLEVVCYTSSSMPYDNQRPEAATWLKTNEGCYINAREVSERRDYTTTLNYCVTPYHFVGILQPQYGREDCYDCPSLDCPSRDVGTPPYVDVACSIEGDLVRDNR
jgi:hypothetical protein